MYVHLEEGEGLPLHGGLEDVRMAERGVRVKLPNGLYVAGTQRESKRTIEQGFTQSVAALKGD
jgi:hypothetical protein